MDSIISLLKSFGPARLASTAAVTLLVFGIMIWIITSVSQPHMSLLYSGLDLADSNKVVQRIESMGVQYEVLGDGSTIKVPQEDVTRIRLAIAGSGTIGNGSLGYEIFDRDTSLGTTSFVQNINLTRALEGELARTISAIETIKSARVHLVLPKRRLFSRDNQEARATIFVKTQSSSPSRGQITAIQNLVSSAVPDLSSESVSIIDQKGTLLARGTSHDSASLLSATMDEKKINLENRLKGQIENLLEKILGTGKVRAEVTAELDMNNITSNSEIYDPEGGVILSQTTSEITTNDQENADNENVSISQNLPDNNEPKEAGIKTQNISNNSSETINYQNSKTLRTQIHEAGTIKKISVSVIVDGQYQNNDDGTAPNYSPQTEATMEKFEELVKSAIGFDNERGDSVTITNLQFAPIDFGEMPVEPGLFSFNKGDMLRLIEGGIAAVVALLLIFIVLRPLIKRMTETPPQKQSQEQYYVMGPDGKPIALPPGQMPSADQIAIAPPAGTDLATLGGGAGENLTEEEMADAIDLASVEGKIKATSLKKIGELVNKHPDESVAVVRQWLYN